MFSVKYIYSFTYFNKNLTLLLTFHIIFYEFIRYTSKMKKITLNTPCPCGSHIKYKKCCALYHKGAFPKTALALMKSRYTAYVRADSRYIIQTTHPDNSDYTDDAKSWKESIENFSKITEFLGLEIIDFFDGNEQAWVEFKAKLSTGDMVEKSHFFKVNGRWLYHSGEFN